MIEIRRSEERGKTQLGWLVSYHSFSFNQYYDPKHTRFGPLRVLNDDTIMPGTGFGAHPHDNMEIVTYVLEGALKHQDSLGTNGVIHAGEVQRMSAGTGIVHSEFNASDTKSVHLLQIWFLPQARGLTPSYEQKGFTKDERTNRLLPVASGRKELGGVFVHQDLTMYASRLEASREIKHEFERRRGGYLYVVAGDVSINGKTISTGDAAKVSGEESVQIRGASDTEIVLFDVLLEEK
jgi:redox-sensitive bicupin YhaK (pirin superfamily)